MAASAGAAGGRDRSTDDRFKTPVLAEPSRCVWSRRQPGAGEDEAGSAERDRRDRLVPRDRSEDDRDRR
jgi:hypothetical protein